MARRPGGKDEDLKGREALDEIEKRLGGMLGPLGEALGRIVDVAEKAGDAARKEGGAGPFHVAGGVRVRRGGQDYSHEFGTGEREQARDGAAPRVQEVEAESWTEGRRWTLAAELPGAVAGDVSLRIEGGVLTAEIAGDPHRCIRVEAPPVPVDAIWLRLVNGVLELTAELPA